MIVNGHQPSLREEMATLFEEPELLAETIESAETMDVGHGRIEQRRLTASTALVTDSTWPGLNQVFEVERQVTIKKSGKERAEVVYGVTSLGREHADAKQLVELVRSHWHTLEQVAPCQRCDV